MSSKAGLYFDWMESKREEGEKAVKAEAEKPIADYWKAKYGSGISASKSGVKKLFKKMLEDETNVSVDKDLAVEGIAAFLYHKNTPGMVHKSSFINIVSKYNVKYFSLPNDKRKLSEFGYQLYKVTKMPGFFNSFNVNYLESPDLKNYDCVYLIEPSANKNHIIVITIKIGDKESYKYVDYNYDDDTFTIESSHKNKDLQKLIEDYVTDPEVITKQCEKLKNYA